MFKINWTTTDNKQFIQVVQGDRLWEILDELTGQTNIQTLTVDNLSK